jgi:hypothetical protein
LAVNVGAVAIPLLFVVTVVEPPKVPLAPDPGAVNVTLTPLTGLLLASFTVACSPVANAVPIVELCGVPVVAEILAGGAVVFVRLKFAEVLTPLAVAVTVYPPVVLFAVNDGAVAMPLPFVVTVAEPPKVPLGPEPGAAKVTLAPLTGLLPASFTVACSAVTNAVPITALCGVPAIALTLAADPAVFVRLKLADEAAPETLAVTV